MKEFDFIRKIRDLEQLSGDHNLVKGIGDDCAVIDRGSFYELLGTDMLVEGDHFRLEWARAQEIGWKSMVSNLSDIAAMGGMPKYYLVSLCLSGGIDDRWLEGFYEGMRAAAKGFWDEPILLVGGDITHGEKMSVNIVMVGEVEKEFCRLRSGAKVGDLVCVTGSVGSSTAGLELLKRFGKKPYFDIGEMLKAGRFCLKKHRSPLCRLKEGRVIARYASAMIDVSDGVGSEVRHICEESFVGAGIFAEKVPIDDRVRCIARALKKNELNFALSGGEDFELVFTIKPEQFTKLQKELGSHDVKLSVVGEIRKFDDGVKLVYSDGKECDLPRGFEHFA